MNRIHAPDGTLLVYDAYEPPGPPAPAETALLLFHGWCEAADRWHETATHLLAAGLPVYVLDQRGHGRSGGRRAHLSRFSQLLGDLQAFRRAVRRRRDVPQVLVGQGFGGLVVLRYLETQPGEPPAGAVVANPWLAPRRAPSAWKRMAARFADLWPTLRTGSGSDLMTAGARAELNWARRAVLADRARIESPLLFVLSGLDERLDTDTARSFAEGLDAPAEVCWYREAGHDLWMRAVGNRVAKDVVAFTQRIRSSDRHRPDE
ncbi:MAG: alpha/beta hydrolase [Gemmatimonadales bacterium]